jgi:hypothetical protein
MRTDMDEVARELAEHLATVRKALDPEDGSPEDTAMCSIETFAAVAMRVLKKSNPSKVRSEARTVEIYARLEGIPVVRGAA